MRKNGIYNRFIKRLFDIVLSLLFIILFCWLYLIVAILVRVKLGSPVLFKQPRPGKDEKIFDMYKFRTMTDGRDAEGNLLPDAERMTPFGSFLRKTSVPDGGGLYFLYPPPPHQRRPRGGGGEGGGGKICGAGARH